MTDSLFITDMPTRWNDYTRNADQIEVFKILNGYENIDSNILFN